MKAFLKNYHQTPRKVRLVVDSIRGKSVVQAQRTLLFMPKYAAPTIAKLLDSAVANARSSGASPEELFIKMIAVNKGLVAKRGRPFARGRSGTIRKAMSHVTLELGLLSSKTPKKSAKPAKVPTSEPKTVVKKTVAKKSK
jgi:large subunit ribosomal protein L22